MKLTDELLQEEFERDTPQHEIARKYGITEGRVSQRLKKLKISVAVATTLGPSRIVQQYTQAQIQILIELTDALAKIRKLGAAYDAWLTDPEDSSKYDIGPRSHEIKVIYTDDSEEKPKPKKATLAELLWQIEANGKTIVSAESKYADPRVEMRNNMAEIRHFMELALELDDRLRQQKRMDELERGIVEVLTWASPEIALEVRRRLRKLMVVSEPGE